MPTVRPSARSPSWSSCADTQQCCSPRYAITASRAPPDRAPDRRSSVRACSAQLMTRMIVILIVVRRASFAVCLTLLAGCGSSGESSASTVVAAFYPLAYAAERIAPAADVENLTPAGAEPHDLELSPADVQRVHDAATVLYLGHGFMPALERAVAGRDGAVDLLAGVPL